MATFAAMIDQMDQGIGKTIAQLEAMGELDNTLILFLSDNGANYEGGPLASDGPFVGEELSEMGQRGSKHHLGGSWAATSNTPLRLYKHFNHEGRNQHTHDRPLAAGIERKGEHENQRGHVIDVMATVVDIAGIEYPTYYQGNAILPMEGASLMPAFRGELMAERAIAFEHEANRALLKGKYKLVSKNFTSTDGQAHHDWELYEIDTDPLEQNDIASDNYPLVEELAREWHQWASRTDGIVGYERWMFKLQHYWQTGSRTYLNDEF